MRIHQSIILVTLFAAACTTDPLVEPNANVQTPVALSQKLVNNSTDAIAGSLLIDFNDDAVAQIERTATRAGANVALTRSGIANVDALLDQIGVTSLRRLFPCNAHSEDATRAAGLHKWYVLNFSDDVDLDDAAAKLAVLGDVEHIEFNTRLSLIGGGDPHVVPLNEAIKGLNRNGVAPTTFDDPNADLQWDLVNDGTIIASARESADVDAVNAWKITAGDPSIVVAVVDEGVKYTHPDLAADMWVNTAEENGQPGVDDDGNGYVDDIHGYNFVTNSSELTWCVGSGPTADEGHATHVAGTVAAVNNNGIGVSSIAGGTGHNDGVKIMSCQMFSGADPELSGSSSATSEAIRYAADNGASILQCSWGYPAGDEEVASDDMYANFAGAEKDAIDYFIANADNPAMISGKGGLVIFSAGNDRVGMAGYPGAYRDYISVSAFGPDALPAFYTNYGPGVNIAAPGGDFYLATYAEVLSTLPSELYGDDYGYMQGTSMACPHVSGVAALGLAYAVKRHRTFTLDEFKSMLLTSVNDIDTYTVGTPYYHQMGTGMIDAFQLLMQIEDTPVLKVPLGTQQNLSLDSYFGQDSQHLTYLDVTMSSADEAELGLASDPSIVGGALQLYCTKQGEGMITISAIAGGNELGTGTEMGGQKITKTFAIVARSVNSTNGGWL